MQKPPRLWLKFFRWFCHPNIARYVEGDITELYYERLATSGKRRADLRFVCDVLLLIRPAIIKPFHRQSTPDNIMFKSYLTTGWRALLRNKGFSFINIIGLAMGMTVAILIGLWVYDEISYDKNFDHYPHIARVMQNQVFDGQVQTWGSQAMQLGPELRTNYAKQFDHVVIGTFAETHTLSFGDRSASISGSFMEPEIAHLLSLNMIAGTRDALKNVNGAMLSRSAATVLFGNEEALNKMIRVDQSFDVVITGIYDDLPENCSFNNLDVVLSWQIIHHAMEQRTGWGNSWFQCLVQVPTNASMEDVSAIIKDAKLKRVMEEDDDARFKPELFLHPMSRWHLYSSFENGKPNGGQIRYVYMFGLIGAFVLLLACINFMNLSTARSEKRAKEVGIRKSIGSLRTQLITQFFTESILLSLIATALAVIFTQLLLPWFNGIAGKNLAVHWASPSFYAVCLIFSLTTGILAGMYPALFLSSFKPAVVLKGAIVSGRGALMPRKVLVVLQFTVSISFIVVTMIIFNQVQFAQNRPIGYTINGVVSIPIRNDVIMPHFDVLREDVLNTGVVDELAASEGSMTSTYTTNSGFSWQGKDPNRMESFVTMGITHQYGKTINWTIREGRDFLPDHATDTAAFVINEAAAKYLGFESPVGETMQWNNNGEWKIIGVVKDMITQSPFSDVNPMIFFLKSNRLSFIRFNAVNIRLRPNVSAMEAIDKIAPIFKKHDAEKAFSYTFADQEFGKKFNEERRIGNLALAATLLAIFISCLGLFGLSSYMAAQRTREIGIRKVLGASTSQLWRLLSRDFIVLVMISCLVAVPVSGYFMNNWLMQFEYRVALSWQVFALACAGALVIALVTVSFQSLKAALANPVYTLRAE